MPTGNLPERGKRVYERVYSESKKAGDSEEVAARKAWGAVKRNWHKDEKGQWVENKSGFAEFSFAIVKVSVDKADGGTMRWRAVASDTSPDLYNERMSVGLFDDFVSRIEKSLSVPEPFKSVLNDNWNGGMPYLSIAHYKSGREGKNVPGMPEKIYRDGDKLKAVGTLHDNELGRAVFKSLCDDLYSQKAVDEGKIRISIGFLDLEHAHLGKGKNNADFVFTRSNLKDTCPMCQEGIGNKEYRKGQLVHLALTRVPVNPRTDMEVDKSMIETKKDDAVSIVGKELSDTLEEKSLTSSDAIVIKSEEPAAPVAEDGEVDKACATDSNPSDKEKKDGMKEKAKVATDPQSEEKWTEDDEDERERRRNMPESERSMLEKSFDALNAKVIELKSKGVPAETALQELQSEFTALGEEVKRSFIEPTPVEKSAVSTDLTELIGIVKSLADSVSALQQNVSTEISTLKAQVATKSVAKQDVPAPRSIPAEVAKSMTQTKAPNKPLTIQEIALRSTYK